MNFSILLASRERVPLLEGLLESIAANTDMIHEVEVLIGIDHDDAATCNEQARLSAKYHFARFYRRHRSKNINGDYINWLFQYSSGKYLIACNDDAAFCTKGWDTKTIQQLDLYLLDKPDDIVYGFISDNLTNRHGMNYCCFPLVSRRGVQILGYVLPGVFFGWNADIACWRVYDAIGRVCDLSGVLIDHISYHTGKRERDHISHHMEKVSRQCSIPSGTLYDLGADVSKLTAAMGTPATLPLGKHGILYSILVPTRDRVELLEGMLESVQRTTTHKHTVEIAVAYDTDDRKTSSSVSRLARRFGNLARFYGRHRSPMLNRDYMNWLHKFSKGTFLIFANDDCKFVTEGWDVILGAELRKYLSDKPDGIVYGKIQDHGGNKSCWCPLLSRRAIDIVGYAMHPEIPGHGADKHLWRIYDSVDRVLDLNKVEIDHITYHTGRRERDLVGMQLERSSSRLPFDLQASDISAEVGRLREHISLNQAVVQEKYKVQRRPRILCVTEKWCDGNPRMGLTNNEHNLFGSLQVSAMVDYERLHLDEYRATHHKNADEELLTHCKVNRPDAIVSCYLFCSDVNIKHETWKQISDMGIPVIFLWFDMVLGDRVKFADTLAPYAALNVILDTDKYQTQYPDKYLSLWTPQDSRYFFNNHAARDIGVCFLGSVNGYKDRINAITALRNNAVDVVQLGGQREQPLPLEAYASMLQRSKIVLNFPKLRGTDLVQAKGRIFEATMCGALLMDAANDQTPRWFNEGNEYISFANERELVEKVKFYLENDEERGRIAHCGWIRASTAYAPSKFWRTVFSKVGVI